MKQVYIGIFIAVSLLLSACSQPKLVTNIYLGDPLQEGHITGEQAINLTISTDEYKSIASKVRTISAYYFKPSPTTGTWMITIQGKGGSTVAYINAETKEFYNKPSELTPPIL